MEGYIKQEDSNFKIKKINRDKAFIKIKKEVIKNTPLWHKSPLFLAPTFDLAMAELGFRVRYNIKGDIVDIKCITQTLDDQFKMFKVIAPYVEENSYIKFSNKKGKEWKWEFKKGKCIETISHKEVEDELEFSQNLIKINEKIAKRLNKLYELSL